jgi:hypothetical protein
VTVYLIPRDALTVPMVHRRTLAASTLTLGIRRYATPIHNGAQ